ncbi:EFR1 family ferrodoxin [Intestinibacter sp.]
MENKIGIIYFSGTGNTKFVAQNIKIKLKELGEESDLINIEDDVIEPNNYKCIIIGGPVYIDRYPEILIEYIKNNLNNYKNKCMLFTTQASQKDSTAYQHFINEFPNLNITYCMYVAMPNNVYNFFFKKTSDYEQNMMINESLDIIEKGLSDFLHNKINLYPRKKITVSMINLVYKMVYPKYIGFINKKMSIDKDKCINCKLCEKSCPVKCIKVDHNLSYSRDCLFCQRCINICPQNAFLYKSKELDQYKLNMKSIKNT